MKYEGGDGMNEHQVQWAIEQVLAYARQRGLLQPLDVLYARNALLDLFRLERPLAEAERDAAWQSVGASRAGGAGNAGGAGSDASHIDGVMAVLLDAAVERGLMPNDTVTQRDLFDAKVMGLVMPRPSEVAARFEQLELEQGVRAATDDFYAMSIDSRYIRMDRIKLNKQWVVDTAFGPLQITINLSKPEKDPRDIAAEREREERAAEASPDERDNATPYPPCLLCAENMGYAGRIDHPARQNHRLIPLELTGERWYLQYSPYVYYNEHAIVLSEEHTPMQISKQTFAKLLAFLERFPHYFVGSNADLPIVGGSILNHDHFQAGRHTFPMEEAGLANTFHHPEHPQVSAGIVNWPMSVIRLASADRDALIEAAHDVLKKWRDYSDAEADIEAYSVVAGERVPHNTITPIARINQAGACELDLVLRNNRTTAEHPLGLFHPHAERHHIKKENIGLIEVMGLAILPGRLLQETEAIAAILTGEQPFDTEIQTNEDHPLHKHAAWIEQLIAAHGTGLGQAEAQRVMEQAIGEKFVHVLSDAGVFKLSPQGRTSFHRLLSAMGFEHR